MLFVCLLVHVFEFEWNIPEEVLFSYSPVCQKSDILCPSWLLLLQDASVDPQTVEAITKLPETSAVWGNERFYLCRLDCEKKRNEKRNNVVLNFGIGSGLAELLLWLCCVLLPLLSYPVDFVFFCINATHTYCTNLVYISFLCIYDRNLKTCFDKGQKEATSFHSANKWKLRKPPWLHKTALKQTGTCLQ